MILHHILNSWWLFPFSLLMISFEFYLYLMQTNMFDGSLFNQDISGWDVSNGVKFVSVSTTKAIMNYCLNWSQILLSITLIIFFLLLSIFNVSAHIHLLQNHMFNGASSFNQTIVGWNVSKGTKFVSVTNVIIRNNCMIYKGAY